MDSQSCEKLERILSFAKLRVESTDVKCESLLKKMLHKIESTVDPQETADIISSRVLLILFTQIHSFLLFKYE